MAYHINEPKPDVSDITVEEVYEWLQFMHDEPPEKIAYEQEQIMKEEREKGNTPF